MGSMTSIGVMASERAMTGQVAPLCGKGAGVIDPLVIDLNLRLLSGRAERMALEASCAEAGVLVDEAGRVTRLRLP